MIDEEFVGPAMTHPGSIFRAPALTCDPGSVMQDIDIDDVRTMGGMLQSLQAKTGAA
jgi:hypothetical protein